MTEKKALCPNCGAEITFRWSGAVQTTCPACRSVLVRQDMDLKRVGKIADVPASMSRIQIGTTGRFKNQPFEVVGRIVYSYQRGHWSEWHIRLGNDSAWLSDAQGEYAVTRKTDLPSKAKVERLTPGDAVKFGKIEYSVASITRASYVGVEGELPFEYWDKSESTFIDLKHGTDGFGTIDLTETPPLLFLGEYESFEELRFANLRDIDADGPSEKIKTKSLSCTKCGAAIELRLGELANTVACGACGSVLDAADPAHAVLQEQGKKYGFRPKPKIPLGTKGTLKGVSWTAIGYQVRTITVEGIDYSWREYLLWNADAGYRYLTEYEDHWNDVTVLKGVPTEISSGPKSVVEYLGTRFTHFQGSRPRTDLVLGEFPWEVRVGDTVGNNDYVAPPLMLSCERTEEEVTWSIGTYTDRARIQEAFKLKEPLDPPRGPFANQPNPMQGIGGEYLRIFWVFALALLVLFVGRRMTASNKSVFADAFEQGRAVPGGSQAFVTRVFELGGGSSNVEITIDTDLNNDWAFFNLALLREDGASGYEIGREVSYYHGTDGGESWREGSRSDRAMIAAVPGGSYYLRVDVERDALGKPMNYEIKIRRDVPRTWPFLVGLVALALPMGLALFREKQFEFTRWQESDYAVETESDDDE